MDFRKEVEKWGKNIAYKYLEDNQYQIIEKDFRCKQGKIDIIAKDKKEFVFIQVKTRSDFKYGNPEDGVNKDDGKHSKQAIQYYIYTNKLETKTMRMDIIEILIQQKCTINHIKQIVFK